MTETTPHFADLGGMLKEAYAKENTISQTTKHKFTPDDMIDWLYETVYHLPTPDVEIGMAIRDFIKKHAIVKRN